MAHKDHVPVTILGGGTNVLIADSGIPGLVIKNECRQIRVLSISGKKSGQKTMQEQALVEAESGVMINHLVRFTVDQGIAGLEHFLGQPGTIGGATYINAHNMNKNLFFGDFIREATLMDRTGKMRTVPRHYFEFGYDHSRIQESKEIVVSVRLLLRRGNKDVLWKDAHAAMEYRRKTQPLGIPSSGCTFRNIVVAGVPSEKGRPGTTSAGYLIDQVGLKGYQIGGAKFSDHHANFILNVDDATSKDVHELIELAKKRVKEQFNIDLVEEVVPLPTV
jgi:UDP-N-acetylmuramate dehydrogenase